MAMDRIMELKFQGYCCSQIIMQMGLDGIGKENEDLIKAMAGLCDGVHKGEICGTLSAAICLLYLIDKTEAANLQDEIYDWFEDSFGSVKCEELIKGNPLNKAVVCGGLVENTYLKLVEMLGAHRVDFEG
jgi:hypothetical protein